MVVNESFAKAHGFVIGLTLLGDPERTQARTRDRRDRAVAGIHLHGWAGRIMPDDRRFAIIWMSEKALAGAYDLDGAFSSVSVKLLRDASEREVITRA